MGVECIVDGRFFFFQAEDGIRDLTVTGVQTCALPISTHADLYVRGGSLLNVYTGEIYPAGIAAKGERIAYVGARDDMVGPRTRVVDARGQVLVPGYIDPHVHPATLTTPAALARFVLPLGTTAVVADTLQFWELGGLAAFRRVADALRASPLRFYWMIRPHAQSRAPGEWRRFDLTALARAMAHPSAIAIGEATRWPDAWRADPERLRRLAPPRGGRVRGHP